MAHGSLTRHERLSSSRTNSDAEDATWQPFTVWILMNVYKPRFSLDDMPKAQAKRKPYVGGQSKKCATISSGQPFMPRGALLLIVLVG